MNDIRDEIEKNEVLENQSKYSDQVDFDDGDITGELNQSGKSSQFEQSEESVEEEVEQEEDQIVEISQKELSDLVNQLEEAKGKEQRALADYQNLVRRTREERSKIARLAARNFVDSLIQPLAHLSLASEQLNDIGLNMVVTQLWQTLEDNGLTKIDCIDKKFDIETMEVIEKGKKGNKVIKIVKDGYMLNNEVVQHAKVILD